MNYAALPSPGQVTGGFALRLVCARAISYVELAAKRGDAGAVTAQQLADFFTSCAAACTAAIPVVEAP